MGSPPKNTKPYTNTKGANALFVKELLGNESGYRWITVILLAASVVNSVRLATNTFLVTLGIRSNSSSEPSSI